MMKMKLLFAVLSLAAFATAQPPEAKVRKILDSPQYKAATTFIELDYARFVRELIELTEIPAPPFKEKVRAQALLDVVNEINYFTQQHES